MNRSHAGKVARFAHVIETMGKYASLVCGCVPSTSRAGRVRAIMMASASTPPGGPSTPTPGNRAAPSLSRPLPQSADCLSKVNRGSDQKREMETPPTGVRGCLPQVAL